MSVTRRIARFLILLGLGIIGFFILSDMAQQANLTLLLVGGVIFIIGVLILVTNPGPEHPPSPRFRTLRRSIKKEEKIEKEEQEERK